MSAANIPKNVALLALGAAGALSAVNKIAKPNPTHSIASSVRNQLDDYNESVHPDQERRDTLFDSTKILVDVKSRKPWNKTYTGDQRGHGGE